MGSPARHPSVIHLQNCMDAAEQAAIERWNAESSRPLRAQLLEIVRDGARAAEASARLDRALSGLRV